MKANSSDSMLGLMEWERDDGGNGWGLRDCQGNMRRAEISILVNAFGNHTHTEFRERM